MKLMEIFKKKPCNMWKTRFFCKKQNELNKTEKIGSTTCMYVHMDVKYASNKLENAYITKWIKTNKGEEEEKRKTSAIYTTTYNVYQCKQRSLKLKLF